MKTLALPPTLMAATSFSLTVLARPMLSEIGIQEISNDGRVNVIPLVVRNGSMDDLDLAVLPVPNGINAEIVGNELHVRVFPTREGHRTLPK